MFTTVKDMADPFSQSLAGLEPDLPHLDPVVAEPQPRAHVEVARGGQQLVLELRRIEGSLRNDLSHGGNSNADSRVQ
jgi:hypothetical protein